MQCNFYQSQVCRSCTQLHLDYSQTLDDKRHVLSQLFPDVLIHPFRATHSPEGSRIRARLAVTGTLDEISLGFYDDRHQIVPVDQCPLHHPLINQWIDSLRAMIGAAKLTPYEMQTDRGELKFVVLTCSPSHHQLMVQFVLRSREAVDRIRSVWRRMTDEEKKRLPVVSINLQPQRSSAITGREEIAVSEQTALPVRFGDRDLLFGPQSFLQTNYEIAQALYAEAGRLIEDRGTSSLLDLYCGVGAFAMTAGAAAESVLGIDVSANAIECAQESVLRNGISKAEFQCRSLECLTADHLADRTFDTIICNPPRRGLDAASVGLIVGLKPETVLYSSCNAVTLHRDLQQLSAAYHVESLYPFDMFPFTTHYEVLAVLSRR
jgi:23S rRNA (uracil747-C5)-methyltransferase